MFKLEIRKLTNCSFLFLFEYFLFVTTLYYYILLGSMFSEAEILFKAFTGLLVIVGDDLADNSNLFTLLSALQIIKCMNRTYPCFIFGLKMA